MVHFKVVLPYLWLYLCRIPELSAEHAARDIVSAVQHNKDAVTVPHNLPFWLSVIRYIISRKAF
jgi:hypothetical protein